MAKIPKNPLKDLRAYRESLRENQSEFWGRFGVTQSAGSRYENGRGMPESLTMLILLYADGLLDDVALAKLRQRAN